jgi:hypothetical protein
VRVIELTRRWTLGRRLDKGSFAVVYEVVDEGGVRGALKLIPKLPGARRELLFEGENARNVVPIIDSGEWKGNWVIVMPLAERSLAKHMKAAGPRLAPDAVITILRDIAKALADLDGRVVNRDIKPANILRLDGRWQLSDFGIGRYAEAVTAPDTRKSVMTVEYAAPERWRMERATTASDVYSLGIVAYEALAGGLPFPGPTDDDFREQHLHRDPPQLTGMSDALAAIVLECLTKAPQARPSPRSLLERLKPADTPVSSAAERLRKAHHGEVARASQIATRAEIERSEAERRANLFESARTTLRALGQSVQRAVADGAPSARFTGSQARPAWRMDLGGAVLEFGDAQPTSVQAFVHYRPAFEIVAHAEIGVRRQPDRFGYRGRSHSLWFCDARTAGEFRWFETAFMSVGDSPREDPFALDPGDDAGVALAPVVGHVQVAWPFTAIDRDAQPGFIDRWLNWFVDAYEGALGHPSRMPEGDPEGTWRTR